MSIQEKIRTAENNSAEHGLATPVQILVTIIYIIAIVSFPKYEVLNLTPFLFYPALMIAFYDLDVKKILKQIIIASPFAIMAGAFNPLLDRSVIQIGGMEILAGWASFASILIRFALTVSAALILVETNGFERVAASLAKMKVPGILVMQLMLMYRYINLLVAEAKKMNTARLLRSGGNSSRPIRIAASMLGTLFTRTIKRAERIHNAMLLRGFDGSIVLLEEKNITLSDLAAGVILTATIILMRAAPVIEIIGGWGAKSIK